MDQESFRKLLQTPRAGASTSTRGSLLGAGKKPAAATKAAKEPAFKPRAVKADGDKDKKKEKKRRGAEFRDRAAERREGREGDFADVEAVLEEFERHNGGEDDIEAKRAFLGGDAAHTVLVRGLDRSLLEQNRARLASSTNAVADEDLEATFSALPSAPAAPASADKGAKRSRADILAALKAQREGGGGAAGEGKEKREGEGERALAANGKFKPIAGSGFKPVGEKKKKKRAKEDAAGAGADDGKRKKKRKLDSAAAAAPVADTAAAEDAPAPAAPAPAPAAAPEPQLPDEFDIFADAGDYGGVAASDSDSDAADEGERAPSPPRAVQAAPKRGWFDDPESSPPPAPAPSLAVPDKGKGKAPASTPAAAADEPEDGEMQVDQPEEIEQPTRLAPLASSAVPSIRDILAADAAAEKEDARRARKEKKKKGKGGGEMSEEAKVNRDLQRLQAHEAKRGK